MISGAKTSQPTLLRKRSCSNLDEDHIKSILQSIVQVKEEKQVTETTLEDVGDDLDTAQTTLLHEAAYTNAWWTRFDELADIAKGVGVDGATVQGICNQLFE